MNEGNTPFIRVGLGNLSVVKDAQRLIAIAIGSSIVIILFDPFHKVGGLACVLLPQASDSTVQHRPKGFADYAVDNMLSQFRIMGASVEKVQAKLVGGGCVFRDMESTSMGEMIEKNVIMIKKVLQDRNIPIIAEDTGGNFGRNVTFYVDSGKVTVMTVASSQDL